MEFLLCAENQLVLICRLWFDVGIKRYTTEIGADGVVVRLWFDVGIKRYTTTMLSICPLMRCGLM